MNSKLFKMVHNMMGALVLVVVLGVIQEGLAIRCWKCSSEYDATCRDYFNTSRILTNHRGHIDSYQYGNMQPATREPHITECEGMHTSTMAQMKNVCLKRVFTGPHGLNQVIRECRMVHRDLKEGACPDDVRRTRTQNLDLEFCGSCEYDGCNSAMGTNSRGVLIGALVPSFLLVMVLRK